MEKLTPETLTDGQIIRLREEMRRSSDAGAGEMVKFCDLALRGDARAREVVAGAINARAQEGIAEDGAE